MLEKELEKKCAKYAKSLGIQSFKFTSPAQRAVPDRLFLLPRGVTLFIEFKAAGKKATPSQELMHKRMREASAIVEVVDTYDLFVEILNAYR